MSMSRAWLIDDIPGVQGAGPKTAAALLGEYSGLAELELSLDRIGELLIRGAVKLDQKIQDNWQQVLIARQLTVLEDRIPGLDQVLVFAAIAQNVEIFDVRLHELGLDGPLLQRVERLQSQWENI